MYIGVATHKRTHTLVALDEQGRAAGTRSSPNTEAGWVIGLAWTRDWAGPHTWGIENSGVGAGMQVVHRRF
jgi:hypothetical protein